MAYVLKYGCDSTQLRKKNVAKYEAATGRLIWWREFEFGTVALTPRDIEPIHGTDDVAVLMRGAFGDDAPTDFLFRVPECGGQEMDCVPWHVSTAEEYGAGYDIPWLIGQQLAGMRDRLFGGANGTTYLSGAMAYFDVNLPGYVSVPFTRGFSADGVLNFGSGLAPPLKGVPTTSNFYLFSYHGIISRSPHLITPGGLTTRQRAYFCHPICANATGQLLYTFGNAGNANTSARAGGCVVHSMSGAPVVVDGVFYDWFLATTPTSVTILDNSIVAAHYDSYIPGNPETVDPDVLFLSNGVAYGSHWYVNGVRVNGSGGVTLRKYDSTLGIVWDADLPFGLPVNKLLADADGIYVITGPPGYYPLGDDQNATVGKYDHDGNLLFALNTAPAVAACLSPDGRYLYTTG